MLRQFQCFNEDVINFLLCLIIIVLFFSSQLAYSKSYLIKQTPTMYLE